MTVTFIINSQRTKSRRFARNMMRLQPVGWTFRFISTTSKGNARTLAAAHASSCDVIAPVGGDGTIHETVNGIYDWKLQNPDARPPLLAPVAAGSGNDLLRNFSFGHQPSDVLIRLKNRQLQSSDLGLITYDDGNTRCFINVVSAGLGPAVIRTVERIPKQLTGKIKFGLAILLTFPFFRKQHIEFSTEDRKWSGKVMSFAVCNGKYFGSGLAISPDASLTDGMLHVTVIGNVSILDYIRYLPALKKGKKISHPEVTYLTTRWLSIENKCAFENDGELESEAVSEIRVLPSFIQII